jgi:predicted transcriptional regulator
MDSVNPAPDESADTPRREGEVERQRCLAWEAEGLARARASIDAGYYATSAEVAAWIGSLGTDNPLPAPYPRHPRPR